jgi:uncharacterized glyoxalase superfamily protein PhnB
VILPHNRPSYTLAASHYRGINPIDNAPGTIAPLHHPTTGSSRKESEEITMANSVKPIPDGYHSITPGLTCRDAARAILFYKEAFGATEKMRMGGTDGKIMHAELQIGDSLIFVNDPMGPAAASEPSASVAASLYLYVEKADDVFNRAVAAGARINVPLQDMFWGDRYGAVIDPFGHHWGVASHIKDESPEEIERGQKAMLARMAAGKS